MTNINIQQIAKQYRYVVMDISEENEIAFKAIIPKFPKLVVVGDSPQQLHEAVLIGIEEEIEFYKSQNIQIPKPDLESKYSGRFILRISPELHEKISILSQAEGKTLNQFLKKLIENSIQ